MPTHEELQIAILRNQLSIMDGMYRLMGFRYDSEAIRLDQRARATKELLATIVSTQVATDAR
jgi:hypothetical protein